MDSNFEGGMDESQIVSMHRSLLKQRDTTPATTKIMDIFYSFNCYNAYMQMSKTRAKPWDNRELDALEGMKVFSFIFTTIAQTAYSLLYAFIINIVGVFGVVQALPTTSFVTMNIAMEAFIFLSCFTLTYRCF